MTDELKIESVPDEHKIKYLILALDQIGMCLTSLATVLQQGIRADNQAAIGGIAVGLQRAALYVQGKRSAT